MEQSLFDQCRKKKLLSQFTVCLFAIVLFYAVVCTPLSLLVSSDILLSETVFPLLMDMLMLLCNYLFYWSAFSIVLYAIYHFGIANCKSFLAIYGGAVFFRYFANMTAGFLVIGFPTGEDFLSDHFPYLLIDILLDLILITIVVMLICKIGKKLSPNTSPLSELPIAKLFNLKPAVQRASFCVAAIPAAIQLISRLIYDFSYGAPTSAIDLLWIIVYYVSDFANVIIGYLVIVLILNRLCLSEEKAKLDYDFSHIL